jgi:primosomal protein N' (replication factor Y) (superfamily II helicase)
MCGAQNLKVAAVVLDQALDHFLDYHIPDDWHGKLQIGMRVKVPVKTSVRLATVVDIKGSSSFADLKSIAEVLSEKPFITSDLFILARWIANYYSCPLRKVLTSILPPSIRKMQKPKEQLFIQSTLSGPELLTYCQENRSAFPKQTGVLDVLLKHPKGILLTLLLEQAKVTKAPISTLIKKKILACSKIQIDRSFLAEQEYFPTRRKILNGEQQQTLECIKEDLEKGRFRTRLIHGVTGSGKTEVYLQAIEHVLQLGRAVIFLVPEISLTSQTIERLKGRFKEKIAILHHRLSLGERCDTWHHIREGRCPIVVGARSAIFSPVPNLGLILVDEEHESSYKQSEESPCYHARDVAVMRGKLCEALVVLGSATPSLESFYNASRGKYALDVLKSRAEKAALPKVQIIDMRIEFERARGFTLFSEPLLDAIKARLSLGEQTLLFLNRRGYHTARMCLSCQHTLQCPHCDINLTFHLGENRLACHLCDYCLSPLPRRCPQCQQETDFKFKGAGTEMVERALHAIFPSVRTLRMDADTTRHKGSHELLFKQFKAGKADVLIGTQMIAKGLHFPAVTLVGVLNADSSLQIPDFRSSEWVFQLLTQVAGRSGRGALAGEVLIQTHAPDHPIIALAKEQDYTSFYAQEIAVREQFAYPPFAHIVKLVFSGKDQVATKEYALRVRHNLAQKLSSHFQLYPVVPCGHARVKAQFRFQFLIKAESIQPLLPHLSLLKAQKSPPDIRTSIDVDPLSTFF